MPSQAAATGATALKLPAAPPSLKEQGRRATQFGMRMLSAPDPYASPGAQGTAKNWIER